MKVLFWIIIVLLLLVIIYQFMPAVQVYVDHKWHALSTRKQTLTNFIDDEAYHVPTPFAEPEETVIEHYNTRSKSQKWGSPIVD